MKRLWLIGILCVFAFAPRAVWAVQNSASIDSDHDGLSDWDEIHIFHTDPHKADTDGDGYPDGMEVAHGYDTLNPSPHARTKHIDVDLKTQSLTYYQGSEPQSTFLIASGMKGWETPKGYFNMLKKKLYVDYIAYNYNFSHIKYNLLFSHSPHDGLGLFIHSAPWRKTFGVPGSHGCVNVAQKDMEQLYAWADTRTIIHIN